MKAPDFQIGEEMAHHPQVAPLFFCGISGRREEKSGEERRKPKQALPHGRSDFIAYGISVPWGTRERAGLVPVQHLGTGGPPRRMGNGSTCAARLNQASAGFIRQRVNARYLASCS
jgi:hypothetical protein